MSYDNCHALCDKHDVPASQHVHTVTSPDEK